MSKALAASLLCAIWTQAVGADVSSIGVWQRHDEFVGPSEWKARWIWAAGGSRRGSRGAQGGGESPRETNITLFARNAFDLPSAPAGARLFITADSHYRLFINGDFVTRGPARCHSKRQSYDVLDVAGFLRPGKNVIGVEVHHYGIPTSFHDSGRPGLLAQLEIGEGQAARMIATGPSWRTRHAIEWETSTPRIDGRQGFVEVLDFRRAPGDWTTANYDDSAWGQAVPVLPDRSTWIPQQPFFEPRAVTKPWVSLIPRDLPYLVEKPLRATKIIAADEVLEYGKTAGGTPNDISSIVAQDVHLPLQYSRIDGRNEYAEGTQSIEIVNAPRNDDVATRGIRSSYLAFDLGRTVYGHPVLEVEGPAGTVIDIAAVTRLIGGKVVPTYMGLRLADRIVLSGKRIRWEGRERKAVRYISLTVRNSTEPVRLHWVGVTQTEYPFAETGSFEMDGEPDLVRLWKAGLATVRAVTTDAYTDNYREQKQYAGTSFYAARANAAGFGDTRLQRRYLLQVAAHQTPNGIMPPSSSVPEDRDIDVILEYNLFWLMGLRDYVLFSGDTRTATELLPVATKVLERFRQLENASGLIENPPYPFWIDHANIDHRGESFALNAIYLTALENWTEVLGWLKLPGAEIFATRAANVRAALRDGFWNEKRGLFADARIAGQLSPRFTEQTNSLALACGLATPEQAKSIAAKIVSSDDRELVRSTPLFMYWVAEGLFRSGFDKEAVDVLKNRFRHMLDAGLGTLWEEWSLTGTKRSGEWQSTARSTAQAEAAFPPYTLTRWVLGVEPVAPGWSQVLVHTPRLARGGVRGSVPLPSGTLTLAWKGDELTITVPAGASVAVAPDGGIKEIIVSGRTFSTGNRVERRVPLSAGSHAIRFR